jgi:hypothetical protein
MAYVWVLILPHRSHSEQHLLSRAAGLRARRSGDILAWSSLKFLAMVALLYAQRQLQARIEEG